MLAVKFGDQGFCSRALGVKDEFDFCKEVAKLFLKEGRDTVTVYNTETGKALLTLKVEQATA